MYTTLLVIWHAWNGRRWNLYGSSGLAETRDDSKGVSSSSSAMFSKFQLKSEPIEANLPWETPDSRVSWLRSPSAHYRPPPLLLNQKHESIRLCELPHPEASWKPITSPIPPYQSSRYSTSYQPFYTTDTLNRTPG